MKHTGNHFTDNFPSLNVLKPGDALLLLLLNFALEYTLSKVQENQMGLKLSGAHQLLAYVDDVCLLGDKSGNYKDRGT
jgi:hypothetical protein